MSNSLPFLGDGAQILAELGRGAYATVYRVERAGTEYAVKVLDRPAPDDRSALVGFHREAALLARVNHPGVPRVFDAGLADGRPYLVMELIGGQPLSERLRGGPLDVAALLRLGLDVGAALQAVHQAGLVHRDVKPANIIIDGPGPARLIDVGLAAAGRAGREADAAAGTFDYSAPEQTGMLARPVDGRADLYALGVVLYQCATGRLPFEHPDVGQLLALHAAAPVPDPRAVLPDLPARLAELIVRLMAKDPDDRVPTAHELLTELSGLAGTEPPTAEPPSSVIGRAAEQEHLAACWRRARAGRGATVLLHGPAGTGKSVLARELTRTARSDGALVLTGKCGADTGLPLASLRAAVDAHLGDVLALPAERRAAAVEDLRAAAGAGAGLLHALSPALAELLGSPRLDADDLRDQFAAAVASLLAALAVRHGGLLLLIDDVQWLDPAGRDVLRRLTELTAGTPLLVVATARDDEPIDFAAGDRVAVGPLGDEASARLVSSYLAGASVSPDVLAELTARGRGNPFTILEYLHALIEAGALRPCWGEWRLDTGRLQAIDLPSDVVQLILARIDGLGAGTHRTLTTAAALGFRFEPGVLAEVLAGDPARSLAEAVEWGLLHQDRDGYAFVHDRVREALLSAVEPAASRRLHLRIATVLAGLDRDDPPHVYALARHYADAGLDGEPERVFATGLAAGRLALTEHAPDAAIAFLETAAAGARAAGLDPDSRFRETLAVAYLGAGDTEAARAQLEPALAVETDPVRRAELLLQLAHVHRIAWRLSASIACARSGLAELGRGLPGNPVLLVLATVGRLLAWLLTVERGPAERPATGAEADRLRLHARLCRAGAAASALGLRPLAMAFNVQGIRRVRWLGDSAEYVLIYSSMGVVATMLRLRRRRKAIFRRLSGIAAKLADPPLQSFVTWIEAYAEVTAGRGDTAAWAEAAERDRRWLEIDHYFHAILGQAVDLITRGYPDEATTWLDRARTRVAGAEERQPFALALMDAMVHSLRGGDLIHPAMPARLGEPGLDVVYTLQLAHAAAQIAVEQDDLGEAFGAAADVLAAPGISLVLLTGRFRNVFVPEAFGRLARCRRSSTADRDASIRAAAAAVDRLGRVASGRMLRCFHAVARADLAQVRGDHTESLALLAGVEKHLAHLDAPLAHFEAARVRARALRALGDEAAARVPAELALLLATRHGWARRARWVRAEFGVTERELRQAGQHSRQTDLAGDRYRRRLEALQQVGAAAASVLDPHQLARVALDQMLHILGAERAILFVSDDQGRPRPTIGRTGTGELPDLDGYSASLVDRVAAGRQALVVTGSEEGAALGSRSTIVHGLRSIMIAPLEREGRLLGVVYLDSRVAKGVFTDDDIAILTAINNQVAVALETARAAQLEVAVEAARRQRDTAESLRAAMSELIEILVPGQVLDRLREIAARALPADRVCLLHDRCPEDAAAGAALLALTASAGGSAVDAPHGLDVLVGDAPYWLAAPLPTPGHGRGVLIAGGARPFTPAQLDIAAALAGQGGAAYTNARLFAEVRQLATTDGLTGVYNRRHFTELAGRQVGIAIRNQRPLTALMVDIDHFKKVNDRYGHATGDDAIRAVATVLRTGIREPDLVCRYGGEEFALVMSEMHGIPADTAERLRKTVETLSVPGPHGPVHITVSIGVADLRPGDSLDTVLARADEALYRAKEGGRNQVRHG